jgi:excisionase family DNA binding protein
MSDPRTTGRISRPSIPVDINQRYSMSEACGYLATSHTTLYAAIAAGKLKVIRDGKRVFVPGSEISRLSQPQAAA